MTWTQALILGLVQGLTEFLPVSSSGHLVIFNHLFGEYGGGDLTFTVFLHFATLVSVFIMFWRDIWLLIREFFAVIADIFRGKFHFNTPERRFLLMVIIGTIPAAVVGMAISLLNLTHVLENIFVVAAFLLVTAALMFSVDKLFAKRAQFDQANAPYKSAWIVGIMQGIAIFPGLSRSGSTIFGGALAGLQKDFAVRYAFILSIPAILGAGLLEGLSAVQHGIEFHALNWVVGFVAAAVSGVLAISVIKLLIRKRKFYLFGFYCVAAAIAAFVIGISM
ncbi:MAG: undecaprenyl-diphosphate phosphatase [Oscillospiraceae bacterium]|nr:undecaprenyl-diphosphate phosphatase [Oscillospiraceae bacterium]